MSIMVTDNNLGYDAIQLFCETDNSTTACQDVIVECGTDGTTCFCPVTYNQSQGIWYCNGQCGTSTCTATNDNNYIWLLFDLGTALVILAGILATLFFVRRRYMKKKNEIKLY